MKSKIPFGKKADDVEDNDTDGTDPGLADKTGVTDISNLSDLEIDDADEAPSANQSLMDKLKNKISGLTSKGGKKATRDEAEDDDEDVASAKDKDVDAAKKKRSLIIKVVIALAIIFIIFQDDILPPEPTEVAAPALKPRARPKKVQPAEGTPAATTSTETAAAPETPVTAPTETAPTETPASVEVATTDVAETASTETPASVDAATTDVAETPIIDTPPAESVATDTVAEEPVITETTPAVETATDESISETNTVTETELTDSSVDSNVAVTETSEDSVDGTVTEATDENLTDKILLDLEKQAKASETEPVKKEYVAPPDYEYVGRGLVYNCTGKHWACVDGASYKVCEQNASGNKFLKKAVECYPFNVYQGQKGCESIQNRMVSSSAKTSFCSGN